MVFKPIKPVSFPIILMKVFLDEGLTHAGTTFEDTQISQLIRFIGFILHPLCGVDSEVMGLGRCTRPLKLNL